MVIGCPFPRGKEAHFLWEPTESSCRASLTFEENVEFRMERRLGEKRKLPSELQGAVVGEGAFYVPVVEPWPMGAGYRGAGSGSG